jgi:quercetin 2,3-dioxygenase
VSNLELAPAETECPPGAAAASRTDLLEGRDVPLGRHTVVRRLLPHTNRRTVGAWCFFDHFGPENIADTPGMQVPPHPHCGLQTVTWLVAGEVLHRDSLGTLATIRPGQLNLMTAGFGIAHSEESPDGHTPVMHGLQLWIALPREVTEARFEHHEDLPVRHYGGVAATVVIGTFDGADSPARVHTPLAGVEIAARGSASLPVRPDWEYAAVLVDGTATVAGAELPLGVLLYLGTDRSSLDVDGDGRVFLIGGEPFEEELVMWWNFVARSHEEIVAARTAWMAHERFGEVHGYAGDRLPAPELPTVRLKPRSRHGRPLPPS